MDNRTTAGNDNAVVASHFSIIDDMLLRDIVVTPPWEGRNPNQAWVRGSIRIKNLQGRLTDLIITGPRLRIIYSGCQWNKICFADNADPGVQAFTQWLRTVGRVVQEQIFGAPGKFKPGSKTSGRFSFDIDLLKPSTDPSLYPDEIRTRLMTQRQVDSASGETVDKAIAGLMMEGTRERVDPSDIRAGGYLIPIFKVSYYRNVERFGLVLTVMKGLYTPPAPREEDAMEWEIDMENVVFEG